MFMASLSLSGCRGRWLKTQACGQAVRKHLRYQNSKPLKVTIADGTGG
jgi:hypothetical protein